MKGGREGWVREGRKRKGKRSTVPPLFNTALTITEQQYRYQQHVAVQPGLEKPRFLGKVFSEHAQGRPEGKMYNYTP